MKFSDAAQALDGIPYTSPHKGRIFYDFIMEHRLTSALELGFAHGVSSGYFAAALDETDGRLDAVDLANAGFDPAIEQLLEKLGLQHRVNVFRETSSYTWFLHQRIAEHSDGGACKPIYDFIFVDGPKDWTNDGATFFMAAKLLKPGGWIMFDDYSWNYRDDERIRGKTHDVGYIFQNMSEEEFSTPQIKEVFHLLVMQHPEFGDFSIIDDQLAVARKVKSEGPRELVFRTKMSLLYSLRKALRKAVGRS